jgi:hypothetical protein
LNEGSDLAIVDSPSVHFYLRDWLKLHSAVSTLFDVDVAVWIGLYVDIKDGQQLKNFVWVDDKSIVVNDYWAAEQPFFL